jgi:hypothetical protein
MNYEAMKCHKSSPMNDEATKHIKDKNSQGLTKNKKKTPDCHGKTSKLHKSSSADFSLSPLLAPLFGLPNFQQRVF